MPIHLQSDVRAEVEFRYVLLREAAERTTRGGRLGTTSVGGNETTIAEMLAEICGRHGRRAVSVATYYRWRRQQMQSTDRTWIPAI